MHWARCFALCALVAGLVYAADAPNPDRVDFAVLFVITATTTAAQFRTFIENLRTRLADRATTSSGTSYRLLSHDRPVLPVVQARPTRFFDIVLEVADTGSIRRRLRLRFDSTSLYILGHRIETSQNWVEFRPLTVQDVNKKTGKTKDVACRPPFSPGTTYVPFGETYNDIERYGKQSRRNTKLGRMPLIAAVKSLLNPAAPPQNHARAYLVLAQMLAEGTRFRDLLTHITTHWGGDEGALPPADMVSRQNQWSAMSAALLHVDANSDTGDSRVRIRQILGDNSATLEHLLLYIAVVLRSDPLKFLEDKSNQPGPSGSGKHRRYAKQSMEVKRQGQGTVGMPARGWIPLGRQLVQIFSVSISDPRGGLLYVFGTIKVTDCTGSYFIYNRPVGPPITMSSNAELPLNYPPYAISAEDRFTIDVDIGHAVLLSRPMVAKGTIELDPNTNLNGAGYMYEKPQSIRVNGTDRWADVKFMIMGDAAEAQIDVRMVEGDDLLFDNVYGTIVASFSNLGQTYSFTLFEKSASNNIKLNANEEVPLQRSVFAVPMKAKLKISLDLWDKDETSDDDRIGFGDCLFAPILFMSESQWVTGDTGRFEVRVSWL